MENKEMEFKRQSDYSKFKRPRVLHGYTIIIQSGCGKLHVTVNFSGAYPMEVYARSSTSGGCEANVNCIGRLISKMLQFGTPIEEVLDQLHSVKCPTAMKSKDTKIIIEELEDQPVHIKSCSDAIGRAIETAMNMMGTVETKPPDINKNIPNNVEPKHA